MVSLGLCTLKGETSVYATRTPWSTCSALKVHPPQHLRSTPDAGPVHLNSTPQCTCAAPTMCPRAPSMHLVQYTPAASPAGACLHSRQRVKMPLRDEHQCSSCFGCFFFKVEKEPPGHRSRLQLVALVL